ncbi:hypothetical protein [Sphingopyxis bauzanensis]|uniref:hypothetical protein n=1 Tax=Sphingopyxis bauzanensis TaxID=651663 RepID=UPI001303DBE9|nr:hypothetical protein [Sphingopyxis bauzanensis]GGJ53058.1 hypothetical protein GCM10011393_24110 [Sphingopyxis bauzanensis]
MFREPECDARDPVAVKGAKPYLVDDRERSGCFAERGGYHDKDAFPEDADALI